MNVVTPDSPSLTRLERLKVGGSPVIGLYDLIISLLKASLDERELSVFAKPVCDADGGVVDWRARSGRSLVPIREIPAGQFDLQLKQFTRTVFKINTLIKKLKAGSAEEQVAGDILAAALVTSDLSRNLFTDGDGPVLVNWGSKTSARPVPVYPETPHAWRLAALGSADAPRDEEAEDGIEPIKIIRWPCQPEDDRYRSASGTLSRYRFPAMKFAGAAAVAAIAILYFAAEWRSSPNPEVMLATQARPSEELAARAPVKEGPDVLAPAKEELAARAPVEEELAVLAPVNEGEVAALPAANEGDNTIDVITLSALQDASDGTFEAPSVDLPTRLSLSPPQPKEPADDAVGEIPAVQTAALSQGPESLSQGPESREADPPWRQELIRVEARLGLATDDRANVQRRLVHLGFDPRGIDGVFGKQTRAAISSWQLAREYEPTGFLDAEQKREIERATADLDVRRQLRTPAPAGTPLSTTIASIQVTRLAAPTASGNSGGTATAESSDDYAGRFGYVFSLNAAAGGATAEFGETVADTKGGLAAAGRGNEGSGGGGRGGADSGGGSAAGGSSADGGGSSGGSDPGGDGGAADGGGADGSGAAGGGADGGADAGGAGGADAGGAGGADAGGADAGGADGGGGADAGGADGGGAV